MSIILYANRNTGMVALIHLLARGFDVKVIADSKVMREIANRYAVPVVTLDTMGEFDLFICCHGRKIIPNRYLIPGKFINIHPCLYLYKGHNPVKRYIANGDTKGSVESQYMVEEVDAGKVINQQFFETGVVKTYAEFYNKALIHYIRCLDETI